MRMLESDHERRTVRVFAAAVVSAKAGAEEDQQQEIFTHVITGPTSTGRRESTPDDRLRATSR